MKGDLARVSKTTPIVVLAHIPLWTIWEPWGWGTADSAQAAIGNSDPPALPATNLCYSNGHARPFAGV